MLQQSDATKNENAASSTPLTTDQMARNDAVDKSISDALTRYQTELEASKTRDEAKTFVDGAVHRVESSITNGVSAAGVYELAGQQAEKELLLRQSQVNRPSYTDTSFNEVDILRMEILKKATGIAPRTEAHDGGAVDDSPSVAGSLKAEDETNPLILAA